MNEVENEGASADDRKSAIEQDLLFVTSCFNKLTLLLSQCSVMQCMQRIKVLIQLIHYWEQNIDVSITILQKDSMQQSQILLKEEPCLEECEQMEEKMCEDIYQQDEDFQFDQHSSQYLTFDAIQNSSNASVDASSSAVHRLYDSGSSTLVAPEKTVCNDNDKKFESITMPIPSLPDGIEIGLESNTLRYLCGVCGSGFSSIADRNKHLCAYHLDRSSTKKKSFVPGPNEIFKVDQPKTSSRAGASKANVSVTSSDSNKTIFRKDNVNNSSASKMSLDENGLDCSGKTSAYKTSSSYNNTNTTTLNRSSSSTVNVRKNSGGRRAKSVHKTSSSADNTLSKKSKVVRSNMTDIYSDLLCELNNDCGDSKHDNNQESDSDDVVENTISAVNSNNDSIAIINKDVNSSDCNDKEQQLHKLKGELSCTKCNKTFRSIGGRASHIGKCHRSNNLKIVIPQNPYKCSVCQKRSFANLNTLQKHLYNDHQVTDPPLEYENGGYACEVCDKQYMTKRSLLLHLRDHDPDAFKPFECSTCGMRFKLMALLRSHNLVHTGERPYKCTMCDKAYQQEHNLKDHIKMVHHRNKPFICFICGSGYISSTLLKYHMSIHTGEKPYKCNICNKSFRTPRLLQAHKYTHRNYTAFVCKVCGAQFKRSGALSRHSFIHADKPRHSCSVCGKGFNTPWNLRVHMRVHSGERPYVCGVCGMSFPHSGTWKKHEETHK